MDAKQWEQCVDFHGHACPGLAIGARACEAAMERLDLAFTRDEELVYVAENDACGVDAVQVLTGCSLGKGNLIYKECGKMAFSFFSRSSGTSIRVVFKKPLSPDTMDRTAMQEHILNAPLDELFEMKTPSYDAPIRARFFATLLCKQCGEGMTEHSTRLQEGQKVCLDCFVDYSRRWK